MIFACLAGFLFFSAPRLSSQVITGIDVLEAEDFRRLEGKRIGIITNQTGRNREGKNTWELLWKAPSVKLVAIFAPEHGFQGNLEQEEIGHSTSSISLPIYSLYGQTRRPTPQMMEGLDLLVFDMQDVGARFYTYATTLGYAMEAAAKAGKEFLVLDRPNPVNGERIEGARLDPELYSFIGYSPIPTRHGMTLGELARYYNEVFKIGLELTVIPMQGWSRRQWYDQTGLPWVAPSPNMPDLASATLYPGIAVFEAVNVSVGRGTPWPFRWVGAPWLDSLSLSRKMKKLKLPGLRFYPVEVVPAKEPYAGQVCQGLLMEVADRDAVEATALFAYLLFELRSLHSDQIQIRWDRLPHMVGLKDLRERYQRDQDAKVWIRIFHRQSEEFRKERKKYLLYP